MSARLGCLTFLAFAALGACGGASGPPPSAPSALVGKTMPDFRKRTLAGEELDTLAMRGHPIVIKFFADFCEPCKRTLPAVQRMRQELPEVRFIGVSEDEDAAVAQAVTSRFGLTFPVVHDPGQQLAGRFRVTELPATFVIGSDGTVRWMGGPAQSDDDLVHAIAALAR